MQRVRELPMSFYYFVSDIKIAHTIFALPFALSAFCFWHNYSLGGAKLAWILLCMLSARSFAMGANRYLDRTIDGDNPRTAGRLIPSGRLDANWGLFWTLIWAAIFVVGARQLGTLALGCSVPLLAILGSYSLMKRISWLTHWYLGACLGLAPIAVSIACFGAVNRSILMVGAAVALWTAGFDIIYAQQDRSFDMFKGLHSVPARFGVSKALWISRVSFAGASLLFVLAGLVATKGTLYYCGVGLLSAILVYEHWLIRDLPEGRGNEKIDVAFFNVNGFVSIAFFVFAAADYWLGLERL